MLYQQPRTKADPYRAKLERIRDLAPHYHSVLNSASSQKNKNVIPNCRGCRREPCQLKESCEQTSSSEILYSYHVPKRVTVNLLGKEVPLDLEKEIGCGDGQTYVCTCKTRVWIRMRDSTRVTYRLQNRSELRLWNVRSKNHLWTQSKTYTKASSRV